MAKTYPNSSILSIITQQTNNAEKVLFIYVKAIPEFYPHNDISWYKDHGKDGSSKIKWKELSIRQWVACGKDATIHNFLKNIFVTSRLTILNLELKLIFPTQQKKLNPDELIENTGEILYSYLQIEDENFIPKEFFQKENLNVLSGYKIGSNSIKPLFPLGFFETNMLYSNLKKSIWCIKEKRTPYLTFRGVRDKSGKSNDYKEMYGFYQQEYSLSSDYKITITEKSSLIIGEGYINKDNGLFAFPLSQHSINGAAQVYKDDLLERTQDFVLLQGITIHGGLASNIFTDTYGRKHLITKEKKIRPSKISNFTWQRDMYVNPEEANQKLSDLFKLNFDFLGPKILIADPYFMGTIKQDQATKTKSLKDCQTSLLNSLFHSAVEKGISQVHFMGCWQRAKNLVNLDDIPDSFKIDGIFESYDFIFNTLISQNSYQKYLATSSIKFWGTTKDFHNRYWFSIAENDGIEYLDKCIIMTNSIGNINEIDIIPILDKSQEKQITRKYTELFKTSQLKLEI